jgi:condensin-2 complex subunit D3
MSAEHRFSTSAKLANEVLAGVADGLLPLEEATEVLRDALTVLACKEIKVGPGPGQPLDKRSTLES